VGATTKEADEEVKTRRHVETEKGAERRYPSRERKLPAEWFRANMASDAQRGSTGPKLEQSTTSRWQRIVDQLKHLRVVDKVKDPAYCGRGKTIPGIWSILCNPLGLGEVSVAADADEVEKEPMDEVAVEAEPQREREGDAEGAISAQNEGSWDGQLDNFDGD
jgi:hypothetical protein